MSVPWYWVALAVIAALSLLSIRALCKRVVRRCDRIIQLCQALLAALGQGQAVPPPGLRR